MPTADFLRANPEVAELYRLLRISEKALEKVVARPQPRTPGTRLRRIAELEARITELTGRLAVLNVEPEPKPKPEPKRKGFTSETARAAGLAGKGKRRQRSAARALPAASQIGRTEAQRSWGDEINERRHAEKLDRQEKALALVAAGSPIATAMRSLGVTTQLWYVWREDPQFRARAESAWQQHLDAIQTGDTRPLNRMRRANRSIRFRHEYFGHSTSSIFQGEIVRAVRDCPPGKVTIVTGPPGGGKTTTLADLICEDIAADPNWRGAYVHASIKKASETLGQIKRRMEPGSPTPKYLHEFGPFQPAGQSKAWGAHEITVAKASHDEKDPTFQAKSLGSFIQGSRLNLMLIDDVQSRATLQQTTKICDTLQQDFFTRTAAGVDEMAIVIVNSRVGERDVPAELAKRLGDTGALFRWINVPAIDDAGHSYDPVLWPMEKLMAQKARTTEEIWECCYMGSPQSAKVKTFPWQLLDSAKNPGRRVGQSDLPMRVAGLDPALGGANVLTVCAWGPDRFEPIFQQADRNLGRTEQILAIIQSAHDSYPFTVLVIEINAFQRGLAHDERLLAWAARKGVTLHEHTTGYGKLDDTLGVASMAGSISAGEMNFPWADGDARKMWQPCLEEFEQWRPDVATRFRVQDRVMSIWFAWLWFQQQRESLNAPDSDAWSFQGLGYTPTAAPAGRLWTPRSA